MYTHIAIMLIVFTGSFLSSFKDAQVSMRERIADSFLFAVFVSFVFFPIILGLTLIVQHHVTGIEYETESSIDIHALSAGSQTEGGFFIGIGRVRDRKVLFYVSEEEFGKKINNVRASRSYIVEDDEEKPRLERLALVRKDDRFDNWLHPPPLQRKKKVFYIPEGSIKENYHIEI